MSEKSKARIGLRLKEKVGKKAKNRSGELVAMTERFEVLKSKMKVLVASLHAQHASMVQLNNTRQEVAKNVGAIAEHSPIYDFAGQLPGSETPKGAVTSYASVHQSMANRNKMYIDRYKQFVVDYAIEWEKVVITRISNDLKTSEKLRLDLDHYQTKVENLRKSVNSTMAKGKLVDPKTSEKLKRNEEKLSKSRGEYEDYATQLCILIEEITERAWKDLHPLLIKMAQFDATLASDEAKLFGELNGVVNNLKNVAQQHGLKPQARLKELSQMSAAQIDTKGADSALRLTDGLASPNVNTTSLLGFASPMDGPDRTGGGGVLSPGSVASHGSGAISPANSLSNPDPFSRASSFASTGSFHSGGPPQNPGDMMAVAAASAPPPTLDMVTDATGSMAIGTSARNYSSGSLPPLPHGGSGGAASRSGSLVSDTGPTFVAPPPMAAPPPPPPPTGLSMYSGPVDVNSVPSSEMVPTNIGYGNYNASPIPPAPASAPLPPIEAYNPAPPQSADPFAGGAMGGPSNPFDT
jgi:hypothetical protein